MGGGGGLGVEVGNEEKFFLHGDEFFPIFFFLIDGGESEENDAFEIGVFGGCKDRVVVGDGFSLSPERGEEFGAVEAELGGLFGVWMFFEEGCDGSEAPALIFEGEL